MILEQLGLKKGELDILDGSPPCSSFSMSGNREKDWGKEKKYSNKTQRTDDLFFEYARIIKELQPKVFIAENVKGITMGAAKDLLGSMQMDLFGAHKGTIFDTLIECGYQVEYKVLNSKNYGVPQGRERTIFIGIRNDINKKIVFPVRTVKYLVTVGDVIKNINNRQSEIDEALLKQDSVSFKLLSQCKQGESFDIYHETNAMFSHIRLNYESQSPTLMQTKDKYHPVENRFLTINELIRIQSFPDDYILIGNHGNKWERIGRSVPPLMMKAIATCVYENILKEI